MYRYNSSYTCIYILVAAQKDKIYYYIMRSAGGADPFKPRLTLIYFKINCIAALVIQFLLKYLIVY